MTVKKSTLLGHQTPTRFFMSDWTKGELITRSSRSRPRAMPAENADQNEARFSPDGKFIAYISNHNGTKDLRIVRVTGGAPRVLVAPERGACEDPEWSPCGS